MTTTKRRIWTLIAIVALALFCIVLLLLRKQGDTALHTRSAPSEESTASASNNTPSQQTSASFQAPLPVPAGEARKRAIATSAKNVPIQFWGKVLDEKGSPLPGARVKASIRGWSLGLALNPKGAFSKFETVSAADGRFEFHGGRGDVLTVEAIEKEGYEPDPSGLRSFGYHISENIIPDPKNPILFRMWSTASRQTLISGDKSFRVVADGRVYTIDLVKGIMIESEEAAGDLRLWIKRGLKVGMGTRIDWSCHVEAVDGGFAVEKDPYSSMYLAPDSGYQGTLDASRKATDKPWSDQLTRRLYLRSRGGQIMGRMNFRLHARANDEGQGIILITYVLNPSGSRVLRP